jgi:hypothetical protein
VTAWGGLVLRCGAVVGGLSDPPEVVAGLCEPPPEVVAGLCEPPPEVVGEVAGAVVGVVAGALLDEGEVWPPGMARATNADTAATAATTPMARALVSRVTRARPASRRWTAAARGRRDPGDQAASTDGTVGLTRAA